MGHGYGVADVKQDFLILSYDKNYYTMGSTNQFVNQMDLSLKHYSLGLVLTLVQIIKKTLFDARRCRFLHPALTYVICYFT